MRRKRESFKSIAQELMYKFERLETRLNEATLQLRKVEMKLDFIRGEYTKAMSTRGHDTPPLNPEMTEEERVESCQRDEEAELNNWQETTL